MENTGFYYENILISTFKLGIYANFAAIPMQLIFENLLEFLFF